MDALSHVDLTFRGALGLHRQYVDVLGLVLLRVRVDGGTNRVAAALVLDLAFQAGASVATISRAFALRFSSF